MKFKQALTLESDLIEEKLGTLTANDKSKVKMIVQQLPG